MCVVSMVLDHGQRQWPEPWMPLPVNPASRPLTPNQTIEVTWPEDTPTREEFDKLKQLVEDAKRIDEATGQPDCEVDEKVQWMKRLEARVDALEAAYSETVDQFDREQFRSDLTDAAGLLSMLDEAIPSAGGLSNKLIYWRDMVAKP